MRRGIVFEHVGFRYGAEPVLKDIDLTIQAGEVVALVGMSGGGKSTLADLIPRFYDVTEGRIAIDGVDVRDYTLRSLRAQIALVTQFTFLFNDTVRANIAYGDLASHWTTSWPPPRPPTLTSSSRRCPRATTRRSASSRHGSRAASASVSPSRGRSSRTPRFSSWTRPRRHSTPESERLVQQAIERPDGQSHDARDRAPALDHRRADRIVVVVRGQIVEEGTHEELLALGANIASSMTCSSRTRTADVDPERLLH